MATVDKNFRIKHGLVVEGATGTIDGNNILTENGGDTYILNLVGGATLVKSVDTNTFTVDGSGNLTINTGVFDESGAASQAESNANDYTDTQLESYTPTNSLDSAVGGYGYLKSGDLPTMYSNSDVDSHLSGGDGITYSSGTISADVAGGLGITAGQIVVDRNTVDGWYDAAGTADALIDDNTTSTTKTWSSDKIDTEIGTAVSNIVGLAPEALNTLEELAQAFSNSPDTLTNLIETVGGKQDALTAGTGITLDGSTISVTSETYDDWGAASQAESNANSYTDTAIGNIDSAVTQIDGSSITPNNVTINSVANQYAMVTTGINIADGAASVFGISASTYRTVKALVKAKNGVHTQVSEILLTLDTSNNVAITEYAMIGTNGSLGDVSAIYHASGNIFVLFTPVYDNTDVMVYATALI